MTSASSVESVALGQPELAGLEQPPHDLAAARFRQARDEGDLLGRHGRAQPLAREPEQLAPQLLARLVAAASARRRP